MVKNPQMLILTLMQEKNIKYNIKNNYVPLKIDNINVKRNILGYIEILISLSI